MFIRNRDGKHKILKLIFSWSQMVLLPVWLIKIQRIYYFFALFASFRVNIFSLKITFSLKKKRKNSSVPFAKFHIASLKFVICDKYYSILNCIFGGWKYRWYFFAFTAWLIPVHIQGFIKCSLLQIRDQGEYGFKKTSISSAVKSASWDASNFDDILQRSDCQSWVGA